MLGEWLDDFVARLDNLSWEDFVCCSLWIHRGFEGLKLECFDSLFNNVGYARSRL